MELRERIKILRNLCGYTQDALTITCGFKRGLIPAWELGISSPNFRNAPRLANVLGVSPGYVIYGEQPPQGGYWKLTNPQQIHLSLVKGLLTGLLPQFLEEVEIARGLVLRSESCDVYFLGRDGCAFTFMLIAIGRMREALASTIDNSIFLIEKPSKEINRLPESAISKTVIDSLCLLGIDAGFNIDTCMITECFLAQATEKIPKIIWPEWRTVKDVPAKERILTLSASGFIRSNSLHPGCKPGQDPSLYYWESTDDCNDITHWLPYPTLPQSFSDDLHTPVGPYRCEG